MPKFLAVEIGTYNMKFADININNKSITIEAYKKVKTPRFLVQNGRVSDTDELLGIVRGALEEGQFTNRKAVIVLNDSIVITRDMELPSAKPKEMEHMVKMDASEYLPGDIEEYTIRYRVMNTGKLNTRNMDYIIMSAVKTELVMDFYEVFQNAGIKPIYIDSSLNTGIKYFSRYLSDKTDKKELPKTVALIDLGASSLKMVIFKNGTPAYQQIINHSSQKIDILIANALNIERNEAEYLKISYGLSYIINHQDNEVAIAVGKVINDDSELMLTEIYKHIQSYNIKNMSEPVSEIFLTGGMARMKGLSSLISESFSLPCSVVKATDYMRFSLNEGINNSGTQIYEDDFPLYTNLFGAVIRGA